MTNNKNYLILVDEALGANFGRLVQLKSGLSEQQKSLFIVLTNQTPTQYKLQATHKIDKLSLSNVVGIIPGKSLPNEYVIFSGHYDHLGVNGKRAVNGDSIYNGANDDAAGTTAMIMLSKYFKKLNNNERTLIFVAFTAEEVGGFGSKYFSSKLNPDDVVAMFNIEMIGKESKFGKNNAFITGYERSDFGEILQRNLEGTDFKFYPDPYPSQNLFYRSDNATLAALGVPAHTISTDQIDSAINQLLKGNYDIQERTLLQLESENDLFGETNIALNEVTILKKDTSSMIQIHAYLDDVYLNSYWADGLIIATPTGSTGYSLSCGGPIISPGSNNFVITPIAPHNLNVRPIVIPDNCEIKLKLEGSRGNRFLVSLDSRSVTIPSTTELTIKKEEFKACLVKFDGYHPFETLRQKLFWGQDARN